jgi:hypothetical protein
MRSSHPRSPIDHQSNGSKSQIFGQLRSLFLIFFLVLHPAYKNLYGGAGKAQTNGGRALTDTQKKKYWNLTKDPPQSFYIT